MIALLIASITVLGASPGAAGNGEQRRDSHGNRFEVVRFDLSADVVEMTIKDQFGRRIASLGGLVDIYMRRHEEPWFATNGGMFTPDHEPVGLYIENCF